MYTPASEAGFAGLIAMRLDDDSSTVAGWSSLIGIVTAICGNILISFALNTQRYAHMKLSEARNRSQSRSYRRDNGKGRDGRSRSYGTDREVERVADERARQNAQSQPDQDLQVEIENGEAERQPLIPKINTPNSSSSTTSDTYVQENEKKYDGDGSANKSYLNSPIWWLGISLMIVGEAGNFLAYGFAPASIVSPLGVVALISNCLIAPLLLHEEFRWRDGLGVIIAIAGCVTVVLSASGSNPKLDPDDIWKLITQWEFEAYLGITILLIVVLMVASNKFGDRTVLIDVGLVGLYGGYTALSTKGVASLLSNTIWRVFTFPITYLLVAVLVATAVLQIKYVNRALQRFNSTIVIPTQFVLFTLSVIIGSAVLYRDFERRSAEDAGKFIGGCALTFLGVWCITSGRSDDNNEDESDIDDEESAPVQLVDHDTGTEDRDDSTDLKRRRPPLAAMLRAHTTQDIPPEVLITPNPESPDQELKKTLQATQVPAVRAAVHPSTSAQISSRPTQPSKPPAIHATTSEPVVPTFATPDVLQPQTPSRRRPSEGQHLSPNLLSQNSDSQQAPQHRLLGRHSIADLLPGPLMSPLSSSLTAIVADSLRRGVDHTPSSTFRSRPFKFSRGKTSDSVKERQSKARRRRSIDSMDPAQDDDNEHNDQHLNEPLSGGSGRGRSFSATIIDIFSPLKKKHKHVEEGNA